MSRKSQKSTDILQGTLDMLILKALTAGSLHGWSISKRIQHLSQDILQVNQGSIYPALYRLEDRGFITGSWGISEEGRRVKVYTLTRTGQAAFEEETADWRLFSRAVDLILDSK